MSPSSLIELHIRIVSQLPSLSEGPEQNSLRQRQLVTTLCQYSY